MTNENRSDTATARSVRALTARAMAAWSGLTRLSLSIRNGLAVALSGLSPTLDSTIGERAPSPPQDLLSTWLVLLVSAAMGFLASLGLAAANGADALAESWTQNLKQRVTVIVETPDDPVQAREIVERALAATRAAEGVASATIVDSQAVAELLAPWLGADNTVASSLPLPTLIDAEVVAGGAAPLNKIEAGLAQARVVAEVDSHGRWVSRLEPAANRIRWLAHGALLVIATASALMVALACSAALTSQRQMVSVLRLIGAHDSYIAAIFIRRYRFLAFFGSAIGVAAAAFILIGAPGSNTLGDAELAPLMPQLKPDPWIWAEFAAAPLAFALIATAASWVSVTAALQSAER